MDSIFKFFGELLKSLADKLPVSDRCIVAGGIAVVLGLFWRPGLLLSEQYTVGLRLTAALLVFFIASFAIYVNHAFRFGGATTALQIAAFAALAVTVGGSLSLLFCFVVREPVFSKNITGILFAAALE